MKGNIILLITAFVWGMAFTAQLVGGNAVGAFTFNATRFLLGALVLLPVVMIFDKTRKDGRFLFSANGITKSEWLGGLSCGVCLCVATTLQQEGLMLIKHGATGKSAFITALYVLIVPLIGLLLRRRVPLFHWIGIAVAIVGFFLLSIDFSVGFSSIGVGELLTLLCAVTFSLHIWVISYFTPKVDGVRMSMLQFLTAGLLCLPVSLFLERPTAEGLYTALIPILYAGIFSSGVAYTLQIIGQRYAKPATATVIMSLEAVFGALGGAVILGLIGGDKSQMLSLQQILGAAIVLGAVLFVSLYQPKGKEKGEDAA